MSNEAEVTPPRVPNQRSLFGPIVLIAVGLVFLLVNSGRVSARAVAIGFARYWPALIILWGLVKLIEHWRARREGLRAPGLGFGGVVLLVFLILAGTAATGAYRSSPHIDWSGVREELSTHDDLGPFFGRRFEFSQTIDQPFPANGTLKVTAERGAVRVLSSPDAAFHVLLRKSVFAYEESDAAAINNRVMPEITVTEDGIEIVATRRSDWAGARLNMDIRVPKTARVDVTARNGDVDIRGRSAAVRVELSHGEVRLEDITGNAGLQLHNADIVARNIHGDLLLEGRISDVTLSSVDGAVDVRGDVFGDIRATAVTKGVRLRTGRTQLDLRRLDGELRMSDGALRMSLAAGPLRLLTSSKNIDLDDITGDVRVENRNGEVELSPNTRAPLGNIEIFNRSGEVRLRLPAASGFEVDARVDHGEIRSDFDLDEKIDGDQKHSTGIVNKGGTKINVSTEHGKILLRRN